MEIAEIFKRVEKNSYDELTDIKDFIEVFRDFPNLLEDLKIELSSKKNYRWVKKAKKEKFFFVIFDDSWKIVRSSWQNSISLSYIGLDLVPVISITIHQRPVP